MSSSNSNKKTGGSTPIANSKQSTSSAAKATTVSASVPKDSKTQTATGNDTAAAKKQPQVAVDTSKASTEATPDIRLVLRSPTATMLATLSKDGKTLRIDEKRERAKKVFCTMRVTESGSVSTKVDLLSGDGVFISQDEGKDEDCGQVQALEMSPQGSFLVTWTKPHDLCLRRNGPNGEKLVLMKLIHKKPPSGDSLIQFNKAENYACYQVTNEVRVYDARKPAAKAVASEEELASSTMINIGMAHRIRAEGLTSYSICPEVGGGEDDKPALVATFQVGKSGMPSSVSIWSGESKVAFSNTFRADYCTYRWSSFFPGDVLAKLETSVDATGQSYYGESKLVLLSGSRKEAVEVVCGKEGAVHDFAWSPRRHIFVVVAGKSPARCTLYDGKTADPIFEFGESHKNIASFSPSGRFLCLAGFGNLAGGMDFWDVKRNKLLGSGKADAAVGYGWSPCGRMFMTATLAPRMNVDNGVTLYSYRGEKLSHFKADDPKSVLGADGLLESRFLPVPEGAFPDLPASPREGDASAPVGAKSGEAKAAPQAAAAKKDVYRPPGASMGVVGAKSSAPATSKPKAQSSSTANKPADMPKAEKKAQPVVQQAKSAQPAVAATADADADDDKDPEKVIRKYKKLLRQIEEIEQKGGPRDDNQKAKLSRRKEIEDKLKELEALTANPQ